METGSMETGEIVERLTGHRLLGDVPRSELQWLARHGEWRHYDEGTVVTGEDREAVDNLMVVLAGHIALYVRRGGERRRAAEWRAGDLTGRLPFSRMKGGAGEGVALEATEVLLVHVEHFPELIRECPEVTGRAVHRMLDRARTFTSGDLHDEKLASLGRLAAGLAHELNNPAASLVSNARSLVERLGEAERASRVLGEAGLSSAQAVLVSQICTLGMSSERIASTPLERADREDALLSWMEERGVGSLAAEALAETAIGPEQLDRLGRDLEGEALDAALGWIAAINAGRALAIEIEEAAVRVHDLVGAMRGFTAMDRSLAVEPIQLSDGLATSVRVLSARARERSVSVSLEPAPELPPVRASSGELNQVWVNLIANAIDAAAENGSVRVIAEGEGDFVTVRIIDDGSGITPEDRERIFEPFFTTKEQGEGKGLGLDIVRRLVRRNEGEIEVDSRPGRTEFRVRLHAAGTEG